RLLNLFDFIGDPTVALLLGVFLSFRLIPRWSEEYLNGWVGEGLRNAASIVMITGAGGAFGAVLKATGIGVYLSESLAQYHLGIFLPFIIAAALKTAQGSSTVALITTSALIAPMLEDLGLDSSPARALTVISIGAGAMIMSHANDSYFWVVSQFSGMDTTTAYRTHSMATLIQGVTSIICIYAILLIFL
ncbi:GntP family permease, partial [Candidatus Latescibacterota bacterium]